jgi:hypothetical protein
MLLHVEVECVHDVGDRVGLESVLEGPEVLRTEGLAVLFKDLRPDLPVSQLNLHSKLTINAMNHQYPVPQTLYAIS